MDAAIFCLFGDNVFILDTKQNKKFFKKNNNNKQIRLGIVPFGNDRSGMRILR